MTAARAIDSVTVITPCYNPGPLLRETAQSITQQTAVLSGRVTLQYLVKDGGSTDGSLTQLPNGCEVQSAPDRGMYDAVADGLRQAHGNLVCYLNAGDLWSPRALDIVCDVLDAHPDVAWLTGFDGYYNAKGDLTNFRLPYRYRRRGFQEGWYGVSFPAVQQETTFWRAHLTREIDLEELATYRLAGDFYMWTCFARRHPLWIVSAYLGGFRYHGAHLSDAREAYAREMLRAVVHRPGPASRALQLHDFFLWRAPDKYKRRRNPHMLQYDREAFAWR